MSKVTQADFVVIKSVAKKIGGLLDDMSVFEDLKAFKPDAGSFPMANWLDNVVQRQVDGIVLQGENLKKIYELMSRNLMEVADLLEGQDTESAKEIEIKEIIDEMPGKISKAIGSEGEGDKDDKDGKDDKDDSDDKKDDKDDSDNEKDDDKKDDKKDEKKDDKDEKKDDRGSNSSNSQKIAK